MDRSLWVLSKTNPLRKACIYIASNKLFEWSMLACILANCVTLAMSTRKPGLDTSPLGQHLRITEYVWLGIFTVEMLIRIAALGFALGPRAYLRDRGCRAAGAVCPRHCAYPVTRWCGSCGLRLRRRHEPPPGAPRPCHAHAPLPSSSGPMHARPRAPACPQAGT